MPPISQLDLTETEQPDTATIAKRAGIVALGNVLSRILGLVRDTLKADFFGAGGTVDAFTVATLVPRMLFDLLVGGHVNSALVPVFSRYATEDMDALWGLVNALLSLAVLVLSAFILIVEAAAPHLAWLISSGASDDVLSLAAGLLRVTIPAVLFLSLSGILAGLLYSLKRFHFPAFTSAVFNGAIVVTTILLANRLDIFAMAWGWLAGAALQVAIQIPGLRGARFRFPAPLRHKGLRQVGKLYLPVALGLIVDVLIVQPVSYNLASHTGEGSISWMSYATTLIQFPQGLVASAISLAILPTLSRQAANNGVAAFRSTLGRGLRLVIALIVPAAIGMWVLAHPLIALLFEHGDFTPTDTDITATVLRLYLIGLPFAAVDLLLVFAFYAHQDTLTPALVGLGSFGVYLSVALIGLKPLGLYSLMVADSVKHLTHAGVSSWLLRRHVDRLEGERLAQTLGKTLAASAIMALGAMWSLNAISGLLSGDGMVYELLRVVVPAAIGGGLFLAAMRLLGVDEIKELAEIGLAALSGRRRLH